MTHTQSRTLQYIGLILIAGLMAVTYWYFSVRAGVTTNSSVSQPQGTGRLDSGLSAYFRLDENTGTAAADSSTNAITSLTLTNGPTWGTGQIGTAVTFDGTDDYATTADTATLDFGDTESFTVTGWFNRSTFTTDDTIIAKRNGLANTDDGYLCYITAADQLVCEVSEAGGTDEYSLTSTSTFTASGWNHFAFVWDQASSTATELYINGTANAATDSGTIGNLSDLSNADAFRLGAESDNGNPFAGSLDEMRVYNRPLSGDEIANIYRLTAPTGVDTGLKGYWSFNAGDMATSTITRDLSGARNTGTLTNGPTATEGKVGQALSFDGSDDNVTVADTSDFTGSALTVAFWKKDTNVLNNRAFVTKSTGADRSWSIEGDDVSTGQGDTGVRFYVANGLTDVSQSGVTPSVMEAGKWHHVVAVFNGAGSGNSGRMQIYIDGTAQTLSFTGTIPSSLQNNSIGLRVGEGGLTTSLFLGSMDEVRAYNRALTAAEVKGLYDTGSSDKLGTSAGQAQGGNSLSAGLALYWPLDDGSGTNADDKSTNSNDGTLTNGPTFTTGQIGGGVDFDGTDDFITLADPSSGVLDFNIPYDASTPGDVFTLSAWFNRDTFTTDDTIIAKKNGITDTEDGYIVWIDDATDEINVRVDGNADPNGSWVTSSTTYATTGWHHVAVVVDDYRMPNHDLCPTIFVDGVDVTDTASCLALGGFLYYVGDASNSVAFRAGAESDGGNPFDGKLDDIRVYSRPINAEEVRLLAATTATTSGIDTGLKGYWSFDAGDTGTTGNTQYRAAYDRSGVGNTGTLTNGPTAARGQVGQALSFDGTDDYIDTGQATPYQFANTTFTTTGWFKKSSGAANSHIIAQGGCSGGWSVNLATGTLRATLKSTGSCGSVPASRESATTTLNDGQWHHFAAIFTTNTTTPASNTVSLYVDGVLNNGTLTQSGTSYNTSATNLQIGSRDGGVDSPFVGSLDEIRVYSRALTAAEIRAQYDAAAPDKVASSVSQPQGSGRLDSGLTGYWKLDETTGSSAADASTNGTAGTLTNMENGDWVAGQVGGALDFDGTNEYATMTYSSALTSTTGITYSFWASPDLNDQRGILGSLNGEDGSAYNFIRLDNNGAEAGQPKVDIARNIGGSTVSREVQFTYPVSTWFHYVYTYDGATERVYINGAKLGEWSQTGNFASNTEYGLVLARNYSTGSGNEYDGKLDEVRVYNRALSSDDVRQLYSVTAPTGVDTGLKGYWSFNGQDMNGTTANDRSGAGNNGTLTNGPAAIRGKVGQALSFDGTDDYVTESAINLSGTNKASVALWLYQSSFGTGDNLAFEVTADTNGNTTGFYLNPNSSGSCNGYISLALRGNTGVNSACYVRPSAGAWHHYVAILDKSQSTNEVDLYIDGVLQTATSRPATNNNNNTTDMFGNDPWYIMSRAGTSLINAGRVDEFRVYNRVLTAAEVQSLYQAGK